VLPEVALVELYADDRALMAHDGELFVCGWREAPGLDQMRALGEYGRRTEAAHGPLALLNVAFGGVPKFTDEVRKISADYTRDASLFVRSRAHVVTIPGFKGIAVMSFINTFMLLGRPPRPTKVFRGLDEAIAWTVTMLGSSRDASVIRGSVDEVQRRLYREPSA
jgi:hypothetical protein